MKTLHDIMVIAVGIIIGATIGSLIVTTIYEFGLVFVALTFIATIAAIIVFVFGLVWAIRDYNNWKRRQQ